MTDYVKSIDYECFIRLVRNCERDQFGAHNTIMENLMRKEKSGSTLSDPEHSKLLVTVKKNMTDAIDFVVLKNPTSKKSETLKPFLKKIVYSRTSDELLEICNEVIELI